MYCSSFSSQKNFLLITSTHLCCRYLKVLWILFYILVYNVVIVVLLKLVVLVFCSTKLSLRMRYFNPSDLPQDYISLGYSSIVVPIYDMRY